MLLVNSASKYLEGRRSLRGIVARLPGIKCLVLGFSSISDETLTEAPSPYDSNCWWDLKPKTTTSRGPPQPSRQAHFLVEKIPLPLIQKEQVVSKWRKNEQ